MSINDLTTKLEAIKTEKNDIKNSINNKLNKLKNTTDVDYCGDTLDDYSKAIDSIPSPTTINISDSYFLNSMYGYDVESTNRLFTQITTDIEDTSLDQHSGLSSSDVSGGIVGESPVMTPMSESRYIDTPIMILVSEYDAPPGDIITDNVNRRVFIDDDLTTAIHIGGTDETFNTYGAGICKISDITSSTYYSDASVGIDPVVLHVDTIHSKIDTINNIDFNFEYARDHDNVNIGTKFLSTNGSFSFNSNENNATAIGTFKYNYIYHNKTWDGDTVSGVYTNIVSSDGTYHGTLLYGNRYVDAIGGAGYNNPVRLSQLFPDKDNVITTDGTTKIADVTFGSFSTVDKAKKIYEIVKGIGDGDTVSFSEAHGFYFKKQKIVLYNYVDTTTGESKEHVQDAIVMYGRQYNVACISEQKCFEVQSYSKSDYSVITYGIKFTDYDYYLTNNYGWYEIDDDISNEDDGNSGVAIDSVTIDDASVTINLKKLCKFLLKLTEDELSNYEFDGSKMSLKTGGTPIAVRYGQVSTDNKVSESSDVGLQEISISSNSINPDRDTRTIELKIKLVHATTGETVSIGEEMTSLSDSTQITNYFTDMRNVRSLYGLKIWFPYKPDAGSMYFGDYINNSSTVVAARKYGILADGEDTGVADWTYLNGYISVF